MRFVHNARAVLVNGYVAWLVYLGTALQIVFEFGLSEHLPGWAILVFLALILLGRTLKQDHVSGRRASARRRRRRELKVARKPS